MNIDEIIRKALEEDLGDGDHTSLSTIPENATGKARLIIKQQGILAGLEIAEKVFNILDPDIIFKKLLPDGSHVKPGDIAFEISGRARSILSGERLALNFMQRLSGIASFTAKLVEITKAYPVKLLDTRKTTPLLRELEKYAVRTGGGENHRMGLYDMILIKDNHVDFAGGISNAIEASRTYLQNNGKSMKIEIEVRNFDELRQVLEKGGVDRIMLDNFSPQDMQRAVKIIDHRYETEASGGISIENIQQYAATGVDFISVGALTHQIQSMDMSLKATF
jgi:nicotinate-nucleotide pyrophosphorylase (carboxylating)